MMALTAQELKDDVIDALIGDGHRAAEARTVANLLEYDGKSFADVYREATQRMPRNNGGRHPAPPPTPAPKPATAPAATAKEERRRCSNCKKPLRRDNQHDTCSAWRVSGRVKPVARGVPTQAALARPTLVRAETPANHNGNHNGFRLVSEEEFQERFTRCGLFDEWTQHAIAEIRAMPVGGRAIVTLPKGKSIGGFRDTVGRQFRDEPFLIRVFSQKRDSRELGIRKVARERGGAA